MFKYGIVKIKKLILKGNNENMLDFNDLKENDKLIWIVFNKNLNHLYTNLEKLFLLNLPLLND